MTCLPEGARRWLREQGVAVQHDREDEGEAAEVRHKQRHEQEVADDALLVVPPPAHAQQRAPVKGSPWSTGLGPAAVLLCVLPQLRTAQQLP